MIEDNSQAISPNIQRWECLILSNSKIQCDMENDALERERLGLEYCLHCLPAV